MQLIGVSGVKGSGKSTVASFLTQNYGCRRFPFAGPLKDMLAVLGLSESQLNGEEKETRCDLLCGQTPRLAMQTLGTEWGRMMLGDDLWVNAWKKKVVPLLNQNQSVVVDDVRFPNEVAAIRKLGGVVLRVLRKDYLSSDHPSEQLEEFDYDYGITNSGTVYQLRQKLDAAINYLISERKIQRTV